MDQMIAQNAILKMVQSYWETWTDARLSKELAVSPDHLSKSFQDAWGTWPQEWLWMFRTLLAAEVLAVWPEVSLDQLASQLSFKERLQLDRCFFNLLGRDAERLRQQYLELKRHGGTDAEAQRSLSWPLLPTNPCVQRALAALQQGLDATRTSLVG